MTASKATESPSLKTKTNSTRVARHGGRCLYPRTWEVETDTSEFNDVLVPTYWSKYGEITARAQELGTSLENTSPLPQTPKEPPSANRVSFEG